MRGGMGKLVDGFTPQPGVLVLIVDDNDDTRDLLTGVLEYCGAVVVSVGSAEAALGVLNRVHADVLVSDLAMPGLDGYAFIRLVRALPRKSGGGIPAVAITAFSEDYDSRKAYEAGFDAYVKKPINLPSFCDLVAKFATGGRPERRT